MEEEIWKEYPECDMYLVSTTGKVYSKYYNKILTPAVDKDGYLKLKLRKDGKPLHRRVHRMVALTFIDNPYEEDMVNHKDANVQNNNVSNLEWCDNSYNQWHRYNILSQPWDRNCHESMFTKIKATNITTGEELIFDCVMDCARYFDCDDCCIHNRLHGRAKNPSNSPHSKLNGIKFEVIA